MLITVDRGVVSGHMQSGVAHGLYWRIIRTHSTVHQMHSVYLMVLVPAEPLGLVRADNDTETIYVDGIPSPFVPEHGDINICLTDAVDSDLSPHLPMQWVEAYYGDYYMTADQQMRSTTVHFHWSSQRKCKYQTIQVGVTTFLRRMQPSAEYLCRMLRERIDSRLYAAAVASGEFYAY